MSSDLHFPRVFFWWGLLSLDRQSNLQTHLMVMGATFEAAAIGSGVLAMLEALM